MSGRKPYWDAGNGEVDSAELLKRPAETPLKPFGGVARRERPIYDEAIGRWRGRVKVVPITGAAEHTMFDVVAEWHGPGLPELGRQARAVDAETSYMVRDDDAELATAIAIGVGELLAAGEVPFIDDVAAAMRRGVEGWQGRYRAAVGDAGRAAAEGF